MKKTNAIRTGLLALMLAVADSISAQGPPQPPGIVHGTGGDQPAGGSAPVGGGVCMLLALATTYGIGRGIINYRKNESNNQKEVTVGISAGD
jgi:hypothetical protein